MITLNDISILIVTRVNNVNRLKLVYNNIREYYPLTEIVLVYDNIDFSLNVKDENLIEVISKERVYVSAGYNLALKSATKKAFVFLHDDTFIHKDFLNVLIPHITEKQLCNFITVEPPLFGNVDIMERPIQDFGYNLETLNLNLFQEYCNKKILNTSILKKENPHGGFFMGGLIETLTSIGGFDERFKPYFYEDSDLMLRLFFNGVKFIYVYNSFVYHLVSLTSRNSDDSSEAPKITEGIFLKKWKSSFNTIKELTLKQNKPLKKYFVKLEYVNISDNNFINYLLNYFDNDVINENTEYSVLEIDGNYLNNECIQYIDMLRYIIDDNITSLEKEEIFMLNNMKLKLNPKNNINNN